MRIFAGSAIGAEQVPVGALLEAAVFISERVPGAAGGFGVFAVLAGPADPVVSRVAAIAGVGRLPVLIQGFYAGTTVEAMGISALDSGGFAVVSKPFGRAFL